MESLRFCRPKKVLPTVANRGGVYIRRIELPERRESMTTISQRILLMIFLSLAMNLGLSARAAPGNQGSSQQDKAKACNSMADNKSLKGDDRKNFMQDCLSKAGNDQLNQMSQKDKMDVCKNLAEKKKLTGSDRRSFIKDCMNRANPK